MKECLTIVESMTLRRILLEAAGEEALQSYVRPVVRLALAGHGRGMRAALRQQAHLRFNAASRFVSFLEKEGARRVAVS